MRIWASPLEGLGFVTILLFLLGTINVFSSSFVMGSQLLGDNLYFLKRHFFAAAVGLAGMAFIIKMGYLWFLKRISIWSIITMGLLVAVYFIGVEANGARRWLSVAGLTTFQPSELAKLVAMLAAAAYIGPRLDRRSVSLFSYPLLITLAMAALVTIQPDMGTAMLIVGMCLIPYLVAGIPLREWILLVITGVVSVGLLIYHAAYRAERILAWFNPAGYSQTSGYQPLQSLLAIGSGGIKGTGLGMGASKFYYLPEAHTDFAFAVWAQETGFVGSVVALLLIGAMICYGIRIAVESPDGRGRVVAIGMLFMIAGQAIGNIAMVLSLLPVTGVPMPFFSYGGSALMVNMWSMGMLFSVAVESARRGKRTGATPQTEPARRSRLRLTERLTRNGR
jgi:cell division protein FtsW